MRKVRLGGGITRGPCVDNSGRQSSFGSSGSSELGKVRPLLRRVLSSVD
jgi:hypothetical protein